PGEAGQGGVEADPVVDPEDAFGGDVQPRAAFAVLVILEGDDGVEPVVAAGQLDDDEDVARGRLAHGPGGAGEEERHAGARGHQGRGAEEVTAGRLHG